MHIIYLSFLSIHNYVHKKKRKRKNGKRGKLVTEPVQYMSFSILSVSYIYFSSTHGICQHTLTCFSFICFIFIHVHVFITYYSSTVLNFITSFFSFSHTFILVLNPQTYGIYLPCHKYSQPHKSSHSLSPTTQDIQGVKKFMILHPLLLYAFWNCHS